MSNRTKKDEKRTQAMVSVLVGMVVLIAVPYLMLGSFYDSGQQGHGSISGTAMNDSSDAIKELPAGEKAGNRKNPGAFVENGGGISGIEDPDDKDEDNGPDTFPDYSGSMIYAIDINGGKLWAGDIIRYDIRIKNSGNSTGKDVILSCPLPNETGYINGSASGDDPLIKKDSTLIEWEIDEIGQDETVVFSFDVFVADYVTFKDEIRSAFVLKEGYRTIELKNPAISVSPSAFNTIVCMGDSQIVNTGWPDILDKDLENLYPHADFNTISSAVKGELATEAIGRFDRDIRVHSPDIIVLGYGANDAGESPDVFKYHMDILIRQAISTGAEVFIYGVGFIDTSMSKWKDKSNYIDFDKILQEELCPRYGVVYIDIKTMMSSDHEKYFQEDGIHWNEEGASFVSSEVLKAIVSHLDKDGNLVKS